MYPGHSTIGISSRRVVVLISSNAVATGPTDIGFRFLDDLAFYNTHTLGNWPPGISRGNLWDRAEDRTYDWFRDFEHRNKTPLYFKNPPVLRGIRRIGKGPNKVQQYRAKRRKLLQLMRSA